MTGAIPRAKVASKGVALDVPQAVADQLVADGLVQLIDRPDWIVGVYFPVSPAAGRRVAQRLADAHLAMVEDAVLKGEQFVADIEASRRKGYSPRPLFEAADAIRARRRSSGT